MGKTVKKGSRISAWLKPGKYQPSMLDKLDIPGIDTTEFRTFQHRTKAWRVEGYNPSRSSEIAKSKRSREYRLNVNGFKAWKIRFKNKHLMAVNITLHFRIQGKYVPGYDYTQTCYNLLLIRRLTW